jgi:putative N-acetylmannosamine-6-phosphate epimerase/uncharacterized protein (DUF779 family)
VTLSDLLLALHSSPLIASVQADEGTPLSAPDVISRLAACSAGAGVKVFRLQGVANIQAVRSSGLAPTIGLIKKAYPGSPVYISPTSAEVAELIEAGCEIVALDGTPRIRPGGESLKDLVAQIQAAGRLAMADCDTMDSVRHSLEAGADLIGTTLAGYTDESLPTAGPDLEFLRHAVSQSPRPVIAEGRYAERWQVEAALRIGAAAVVVGGALNDPIKQTKALSVAPPQSRVGAVDIGGTWLRFAVFGPDWTLQSVDRTPNPPLRKDRMDWIRAKIAESKVETLGLGTGGIVDPSSGLCWTAKEYLMPDQIGIEFSSRTLGVPVYAIGDGHATAWGHACLAEFAGRRVATLALGTGVGCGFVQNHRIWCGRRGEYPRVNDLPGPGGASYEDLLGGINLTKDPSPEQQAHAIQAFGGAHQAICDLYFPDAVVVCGSVGMSAWLEAEVKRVGAERSPFGADAGIYGAAALALFPAFPAV